MMINSLKTKKWIMALAMLSVLFISFFGTTNVAFAELHIDFDEVNESTAPAPGVEIVKSAGKAVLNAAGSVILLPILLLATLFDTVAGWILLGMGYILDLSIATTINSDYYGGLSVIKVGWTVVRDFSNMFFIFALLFIAIKTILGLAGSSTKKWVANLIIAAIMINFSLFATKVVIDAGNILALGFWNKMEVNVGGVQKLSASAQILEGLKLQSIADPKDSTGVPLNLGTSDKIIIYALGGFLKFLVAYIFLAGAIMMIIRSVTLILLMIVSPFAFLGFGLPIAGSFANKWLSKLIGSTFVAPAFLAMLYITSTIINSPDLFRLTGSQGKTLGGALGGDISSYAIVYNYVLIMILFLASLSVANAVSSGAGSAAGGFAKRGLAGATAGTALAGGAALRNTLGRQQRNKLERLQNDKGFQAKLKLSGAEGDKARAQVARTQKLAASTFDVRNIPYLGAATKFAGAKVGVNIGSGSTANRLADDKRDNRGKEVSDEAKKLFPGNEEAQARYIEGKLGKQSLTSKILGRDAADTDLNKVANKDAKKFVDKVEKDAKTKKDIEDGIKETEPIITKLAGHVKEKEDLEKKGLVADAALIKNITDTGDALEVANKELAKNMKQASSALIADLAEDHAGKVSFANNLDRRGLQAIQRKSVSEKGYKDGTTENLTKSIATSGNIQNVEYLQSVGGKDSLFEFGTIEEKDLGNYNRNKTRVENAKTAATNKAKSKARLDSDRDVAEAIQNKIKPLENDLASAQAQTARAQAGGLPGKIADAERAESAVKNKIDNIINA